MENSNVVPVENPNVVPVENPNDPVENPNGVSVGNPNVVPDTINRIDRGIHGVNITLATKVNARGEVELKTTMAEASKDDTNNALFNGEPIISKQDFKNKLSQKDKAVGDEFNNIHNKDYETTSIRRTRGKVPSGIEILNMLRRHGEIMNVNYIPIIKAVLKSYNNDSESPYNANDTEWIKYPTAKEAYYKFINSRSFFAKEQAFQFSKKDNMGIIDSLGNAGKLAMGIAGNAGAAVASLAKTDTWTPFSNILDGAIRSLGSINITTKLPKGVSIRDFINNISRNIFTSDTGEAESNTEKNRITTWHELQNETNADLSVAVENNPALKSYAERIRAVFTDFMTHFNNNVLAPIIASTPNITNENITEIKQNFQTHITELITNCITDRGKLTTLNVGEVVIFSPVILAGGAAALGLGGIGAILYNSFGAASNKLNVISKGLSEKWMNYEKQILKTNAGRKQFACNAILDFMFNNDNLDSKIKLALLGLWYAISIGKDAAIEWDSEPGDTFIKVENTAPFPSADIDEIVDNIDNINKGNKVGGNPRFSNLESFEQVDTKYKNIKVTISANKKINATVLLSNYCPENCISKLASGASRTLEVITENLQKITVLPNGAPQWNDSYVFGSVRNYEYNGIPSTFIYALMKRRLSGYTDKISNGLENTRNTFSRGFDSLKGIGRTLKDKATDFYKKRFTRKNQPRNDVSLDQASVYDPPNMNSIFGGKRNKHSKRVAKNKKNKRKTRRH